jgi:hypothetical protein
MSTGTKMGGVTPSQSMIEPHGNIHETQSVHANIYYRKGSPLAQDVRQQGSQPREHSITDAPAVQTHTIYALADPRYQTIRVIGASRQVPTRYAEHLSDMNSNDSPENVWLRELDRLGLKPYLYILERHALRERKQHWIDVCRSIGCVLFNGRQGVIA